MNRAGWVGCCDTAFNCDQVEGLSVSKCCLRVATDGTYHHLYKKQGRISHTMPILLFSRSHTLQ